MALPHYDFSLPGPGVVGWSRIRDWAQRAEEMGFDSLWVSDHLFLDVSKYGGTSHRYFAMECFTTLAALSAWTSRVRLGALVVCNDLRRPQLVAKMAANLSAISNGRFELGLGAGWYEPEYKEARIPFRSAGKRINRLEEAIQLIRGMLGEPSFTFAGTHYHVNEAWTVPNPGGSDRPVPVWVGGKGNRVLALAGRHADGFNASWAWTPEAFGDRVRLVEASAAQAGRDPKGIKKSVGLHCLPGRDESEVEMRWERYLASVPYGVGAGLSLSTWRQDKLAGAPKDIAGRINDFRGKGAEEVILNFGLLPFQISDASAVQDFVREVRPLLRN
ncbi:MAG: LLM class flavin-dependent oxidoreductase [Actinomycetota bacterium]